MTWSWLRLRQTAPSPARRVPAQPRGVVVGGGGVTIDTPMIGASPAHGRGLGSLVTGCSPLVTALVSLGRGFLLVTATLTAAMLWRGGACCDSEVRAGASRFTTRAFLLLLVLAAGVSFLSPAASAQTPNPRSWNAGFPTTYDVTTNFLYADRTRQSVTTTSSTHRNWGHYSAVGCTWTQVEPTIENTNGVPTGCTSLAAAPSTGISPLVQSRTISFTPTQAMIDRGGVIIGWAWHTGPPSGRNTSEYRLFHTEWVPLVVPPEIDVSAVTGTATEAGGTATFTVALNTMPAAAVTVAVASQDTSEGVAAPGQLVFTTTTWGTDQAVTVTGQHDAVDDEDQTYAVRLAPSSSDPNLNNALASKDVTMTTTDDDERGMAFVPAHLVVAAGGTTAYTVALTSEPTGPVRVTLTPDAAVTVAPTRLTFTAMNWATAKPVTLTVAAGTTAPASLVEHTGAGSDYEGTTQFLAVTRMTVPMVETIETRKEPGMHHSLRDNQLVTVTEAAGVPAGARFTPDAPLTRPLTVAVRLSDDVDAMAAAGSEFRIGRPTERVALDVAVTPSWPGRLCLPVSDELWGQAADRDLDLVLVSAGKALPKQERVPEGTDAAGRRIRVLRVCARVEAFSPFAVGYDAAAGRRPIFREKDKDKYKRDPLIFRTGQENSFPLPKATGGEGRLAYALKEEPAPLPAGLTYNKPEEGDDHGGTITGTPTAPIRQPYTLTVRDGYGDDRLPFTIEVQAGIKSRDLALVLAGIGRTWATDAVEILGSRAGPPPSRLHVTLGGQVLRLTDPPVASPAPTGSPSSTGGTSRGGRVASDEWRVGSPSSLVGAGRREGVAAPAAPDGTSPWQRVTGVALGVARALGVTLDTPALPPASAGASRGEGSLLQRSQTLLGRSPADSRRTSTPWRSPLRLQPVAAKDLLARSAFELPLTRTGDDGVPAWTLWGRGAASGFSGQPEDGFKMDGTLYSGYLGLDYRPRSSLLMGLAVAHSTGEVTYERTDVTKAAVDVEQTSLLPYAHWQPTAGLGVWGLLGMGWGDLAIQAVGDSRRHTTATTSWLGAVGGRQALTTWQGIDLAAKTDAFLTTVRSEAKMDLPAARGHAQRVRLLVEGQTAVDLSPVSRVQPRLEVGGRWDSGTAEQGLGLELGGGLAYTQTEWGLSVDMQGRYLPVHQDGAFADWGASVNVRLDPGVGGEGAYLTVAPVWGQPGSGVDQLWGNAAVVPGGTTAARAAGWRPANVNVDVGYGLTLADGRGILTPYGGLVLGDPGTARYRLGSRWAVSTLLDLSVEGERAEQPGQAVAHGVSVRLGWQW